MSILPTSNIAIRVFKNIFGIALLVTLIIIVTKIKFDKQESYQEVEFEHGMEDLIEPYGYIGEQHQRRIAENRKLNGLD